VREFGNTDFDGDDGQHTTASDLSEVNGLIGEPKSSHAKSVLMRHVQTRHVPYYSRCFAKRWKWGNATEMQQVRAVIDCGATSIFMAPRLRKRLGLADEPAYVMTLGLNCQLIAHASESRKTAFTVQYMEHLAPVQESEVLVVAMWAYDLVLGLPWFQCRNPDVNWQRGRLLALQTLGGAEVVAVDRVDLQQCPGNIPRSTAREEAWSEGGGSIPDIQMLGATAFDDLLASEQVVGTFFLTVADCTGLLRATMEGITDGE
jgi:hypothetical protein